MENKHKIIPRETKQLMKLQNLVKRLIIMKSVKNKRTIREKLDDMAPYSPLTVFQKKYIVNGRSHYVRVQVRVNEAPRHDTDSSCNYPELQFVGTDLNPIRRERFSFFNRVFNVHPDQLAMIKRNIGYLPNLIEIRLNTPKCLTF